MIRVPSLTPQPPLPNWERGSRASDGGEGDRARTLGTNFWKMDARVWGGIHFRDATAKGLTMGRRVAHWTLKRYFLVKN